MTAQKPEILNRVEDCGFSVFSGGDYNLNIIAERNPNGKPDQFDDWLSVCYQLRGFWYHEMFRCTTDPGLYWLNNPGRVEGTAILKHNQQMSGAYRLGMHRGKYAALVQDRPVTIWRDRNMDDVHDYGSNEERGYFGINIHRAGMSLTSSVGKYSAGCTVIQKSGDFDRFIWLCRQQMAHNKRWTNFTYTLIMGL